MGPPPTSPETERLYADDLAGDGFVMNSTRIWAHQPGLRDHVDDLLRASAAAAGLSVRDRGVLVVACAAARGDSYCALAWGRRLSEQAGDAVAAGVVRGNDSGLDAPERALARWARRVALDPSGTTAADVAELRSAGYDDARIVAITAYVGLRLAFSAVNGALGAGPDAELAAAAPPVVLDAVRFGRPVGHGGPDRSAPDH
ncbi:MULTISPECIES: carboxymuconolactone decarboxylase family protein [unclassified Geodermatophilus]|uniref:carboxymuconolactone decarboxylase family protein n=1 Tax=unclassified Geodermatophilus TaxID=2637632 RepID=UPI003EF082E4